MASRKTKNLVKLVERRAGEQNACYEVQELLKQGADIKEPIKNSSMIDYVIAEENRHRQVGSWKAANCQQLIQILQNHASQLLAASVLSSDGGNLNEITQLFRLHASCYQSERFGPLGLLGELLKQENTPIRLEVVRFLIENDDQAKFAVTTIDDQNQTCLSLAKKSSRCPQKVQQYLQETFDMILNQIPCTHPQINVDEVAKWIYRGANPETIDKNGNTVLLNAVIKNNQLLANKLVELGCDPEHVNKDKLNALQIAENATPRNAQLVAILKTQNTNIQLKQLIETRKALLTFDEVNNLLEQGANIDTPIENQSTFLHLLIANQGTPEMITAFVETFNANTSAMDIQGYRPVEICILLDKSPYTILQTYLQLSKIPTETYFNSTLNTTLIQFAKDQNRPEAAKLVQDALNIRLWNLVARANTKHEHNQTLIPELQTLITYGAEINHQHSDRKYNKWTVLHLACQLTTESFVQLLIEKLKANYQCTTENDDYPLSIAAEYGHLSIVQYLHGLPNAPLNIANKAKQTPLHLATKNHHLLVVRYLVRWGADHQAQNLDKQTPLDIARRNSSTTKKDDLTDKTIVHLFEKLICPNKETKEMGQISTKKADSNLDTCELVKTYTVEPIQMTTVGDEENLGKKSLGLLQSNPNDQLITAAEEGLSELARQSIGNGANICFRKKQQNAYQIAHQKSIYNKNQSNANQSKPDDFYLYQQKMLGCQQVMEIIRQTASQRLLKAIDDSIAYRVVAYHQAGAPLYGDLLRYACERSDNVQIVDYLINQSDDIFQAMFNYSTPESPFRIAKKHNFNEVAAYLKYRLSVECSKAIQSNNIEYVQKLIRAGASVDLYETENLQIALKHRNADLVQLLCQNGAKMPMEWLQAKTIVLPETIAQTVDSKLLFQIDRCLINRRLRHAAANGDLKTLTQCQHLSADINSENCYGSTALLCSIQHGNYFPIVHALVSRGATILHSNETETMSLITLAKKRHYIDIANYLLQELNNQFLIFILNNDIKSAEKFEQLGADFNYHDEQHRTLLHHAVEHHGIELVSWLCLRGSTPTVADSNGNFPITEAAEKGDYAVVEFFATKYPATKQQKNKAGLTALQIARKQGFKRMEYLLETGQPPADSLGNEEIQSKGPKYMKEELMHAAKNGNLRIIKEFIAEQYQSRDEKRQLCHELITVAEKAKSREVLDILRPYYKEQLNKEIPSDIELGAGIRLNQHYKRILLGFLTGLGRIIADSPVVLDPADPKTYTDLFSHLTTNQKQHSEEIYKISSDREAQKLSERDVTNINEKLCSITEELNKLHTEKVDLEKQMQDTAEKLKNQEDTTAIQREELFKQKQEHQKQLAVYESSIFLYELQQEAIFARQKTVQFFRENENMYLFFRSIENTLQAIFHASLAAQSGYLTTEKRSGVGRVATTVDGFPTSILPFSEIIVGAVKASVCTILSKLDERQQKREYHNISTLGNIEELGRIATDTASLLTLYYKEQIQSIDTNSTIKGSNIFNDKIHWIKELVIDVRPEETKKMPVIIVAEYITATIIDIFQKKKPDLKIDEPLPQQLWFHVAKINFVDQDRTTKVTDIVGTTAGRQKIPINILNTNNKTDTVHVQLRYLIGCASLVADDGNIYQYDSSKEDFDNLEFFGYVYVTPFLFGDQQCDEITAGRKLTKVRQDVDGKILTKLKDIAQYVETFQEKGNRVRKSAITTETARQVAEVLREQRAFVDPKDVREILNNSQKKTEVTIDFLREDIQERVAFYQTSIEATNEKFQNKFDEAMEILKKENEKNYTNAFNKLNERLKQIEQHLENQINERLNTIEKQLKADCDRMRTRVDTTKAESAQALIRVNDAATASEKSAQHAEQAREDAKKFVDSMEQRREEFQNIMTTYEAKVKETIAEQKLVCEQTVVAIRTKIIQELESMKLATTQSAANAKDSEEAAKKTHQEAKQQFDLQKRENNRILSDSKELIKQTDRLGTDLKEALKQPQTLLNQTTAALKKVNELEQKFIKEIERLEKLKDK